MQIHIFDSIPKKYEKLCIHFDYKRKRNKNSQNITNYFALPLKRKEPLTKIRIVNARNNIHPYSANNTTRNYVNLHNLKNKKMPVPVPKKEADEEDQGIRNLNPEYAISNNILKRKKMLTNEQNKQIFQQLGSTWNNDNNIQEYMNTFNHLRTRIGSKYQADNFPNPQEQSLNLKYPNSMKLFSAIEVWNPHILSTSQGNNKYTTK